MRNKREHIRYHHRAVQSNTEFLKYQKRLRATLCYSVVIAIIISLVSCRYSRPNLDDEGISDKTRDSLTYLYDRHYTLNTNLEVVQDSVVLACLPVKDCYNTLYRGDRVVVAEFAIHSADSVDSVWVKLAHSQEIQGWIGEREMMQAFVPTDSISQFIYLFSDTHASYFVIIFALFVGAWVFRLFRRKQLKIVYFNDIDSVYPLSALPCEFPATLPGEETDTFVRFGTANAWDGNTFINPYAQLCRGYSDKFRGHFTSALTVCQNLDFVTKGLSLTGMATFYNRVYSAVNRSFTPFMYQLSSYDVDADGNYSYTSSSTNTGTTYLGTSRGRDGYRELAFQVKLDYARTFNKKHDVGATFVYHQKERNMNISDAEEYASLPYRQQGLAGRVTYGFDKRYLIEANFGYNGSENFAPGKRFGFFPSIAGGWVISNEPFWKGIKDKVNLFKVRASYGLVGNDVISSNYKDRFPYLSTVAMDQWYDVMIGTNFDQKRGPILSIYGNENATWEESRKLDIGVEIGLFDSLNIIFDWFKEKRSGIFMQRSSLPSSFGMSGITPWGNIGKVDNRGVDISIDYNKAFSKDLILSLRGTFTYAHNEIVSMDEPQYKWGYQYKKGHPINSINCLIAEGLYRDEEDIASSPKSVYATRYPLQPGDIKYKDLNNDEVIDDNDKCRNGNPTVPEIIYGFGFSLKYKGFDCSAFFQGQGKVSIIMYDAHPFSTKAKPGFGLMQWIADEHWSESSPDPDAKYPRLSSQWNEHNGQANTLYVCNGKMLRLKTAEIGYSYKMMRVYVSGTNLLTFSPFKYWDPEKGSGNGLSYPLQRTFNLGFQFNF